MAWLLRLRLLPLLLSPLAHCNTADIYVNVHGDDAHDCASAAAPCRTLHRARDVAREQARPVRVFVGPGLHEPPSTLVLDAEADSNVSWIGEPDGSSVISGAVSLVASDWSAAAAGAPGVLELALPEAVAATLAAVEERANISQPHMFVNGIQVPRARTQTMVWEDSLGVTPGLAYNSFCMLYARLPSCAQLAARSTHVFTPSTEPRDRRRSNSSNRDVVRW
eukprot:COSAG06_NODE_333_length_17341_cov_7.601032_13_plen_222_part_00